MTCLSPYSRGLWCAWASGFTSMHVSPSIDMRQVWSGVTTQKSCELMHGCTSGPNGEGRRVRAVQFNGIYSCIRHRGMCLLGHFLLISATRENRAPHMTLWNRHIILVIRYWLGNVFKVQFKQTEKKKKHHKWRFMDLHYVLQQANQSPYGGWTGHLCLLRHLVLLYTTNFNDSHFNFSYAVLFWFF